MKVSEGCSRKAEKNRVMEARKDSAGGSMLWTAGTDIDPTVATDDLCSPLL